MDRRRFEHLFAELSVACGQLVPRFRLWLCLSERNATPDQLSRNDALAFCDDGIGSFLAGEGLSLSRAQLRKLRRTISDFDPELTNSAAIRARLHDDD